MKVDAVFREMGACDQGAASDPHIKRLTGGGLIPKGIDLHETKTHERAGGGGVQSGAEDALGVQSC